MSSGAHMAAASKPRSTQEGRSHQSHPAGGGHLGRGHRHGPHSDTKDARVESQEGGKIMYNGQECEIVQVIEKESVFARNCPILPVPIAVFCGVINIIPGLGTFIGALSQICCNRAPVPNDWNGSGCVMPKVCTGLTTALLQLILAPLIFGWIWSIMYGAMMVEKANNAKVERSKMSRTAGLKPVEED